MDAKFEQEVVVLKLKAAALNNRCQTVLAMADLLSEYAQLTNVQQKQIAVLTEKLKAYEDKSVDPAGKPIQGAAPAAS